MGRNNSGNSAGPRFGRRNDAPPGKRMRGAGILCRDGLGKVADVLCFGGAPRDGFVEAALALRIDASLPQIQDIFLKDKGIPLVFSCRKSCGPWSGRRGVAEYKPVFLTERMSCPSMKKVPFLFSGSFKGKLFIHTLEQGRVSLASYYFIRGYENTKTESKKDRAERDSEVLFDVCYPDAPFPAGGHGGGRDVGPVDRGGGR
jgi:hypothetical protein